MNTVDDKTFDQAVCVHGYRGRDIQNICSAREATEWLLYEWPAETMDSARARDARQACLDALKGACETEYARQAFRAAAQEAGIFIGDVDRVPKPPQKVK